MIACQFYVIEIYLFSRINTCTKLLHRLSCMVFIEDLTRVLMFYCVY